MSYPFATFLTDSKHKVQLLWRACTKKDQKATGLRRAPLCLEEWSSILSNALKWTSIADPDSSLRKIGRVHSMADGRSGLRRPPCRGGPRARCQLAVRVDEDRNGKQIDGEREASTDEPPQGT